MRGKKNQMTSKLGMSQVKHRETISRFPKGGKRARDTKCGRTDYWCQILPEKKPLTYGKNCGNLIQVGLTCALD